MSLLLEIYRNQFLEHYKENAQDHVDVCIRTISLIQSALINEFKEADIAIYSKERLVNRPDKRL